MNSNSKSAHPSDTYSPNWADIMGTGIALLTLILPISVISHYASPNTNYDPQSLIDNNSKSSKPSNPNLEMMVKGSL